MPAADTHTLPKATLHHHLDKVHLSPPPGLSDGEDPGPWTLDSPDGEDPRAREDPRAHRKGCDDGRR